MDGDIAEPPSPSSLLSTLKLLVPPIRLLSAAIWQTVEQKIVTDYGLLEEFVFMLTEMVPQLLSTRQRAELILGLRARFILELCRSEDTADIDIIQPHLDRMETLQSLWKSDNAEQESSDSRFMGLVQNLLRDSEERKNFFHDVFPGEFGPTYDKAIQSLMWLFVSRLEKILPTQSLQQIASLLSNASSVLNECMLTFASSHELKTMLDTHKDLSQLDNIESCTVDSDILSVLCLPPLDRDDMISRQTRSDSATDLPYTVCSEMEVESEIPVAGHSEPCGQSQWMDFNSGVKAEEDGGIVPDSAGPDGVSGQPETLIIGEDGHVSVLVMEKPKKRGRKRKQDVQSKPRDFDDDPDFEISPRRPVRKNRGVKMKRYLSQWTKTGKTVGTLNRAAESNENDVDERTQESHTSTQQEQLTCSACKKVYKSQRNLQQHKCPARDGTKSGEQEEEDEADQSPHDLTGEDLDGSTSAEKGNNDGLEERSPEDTKSILDGPFYCPHCRSEFKCKQTFRYHQRSICYSEQQVDPEQPEDVKHCFRCSECDKAFKYKSTLDSHKLTHNPLYCEVCMKLVRDSEALAMHKESHTPFQCNRCEQHFPVFKALHKHYIDVHNPTEPYICTHCQMAFASLKRFIRHEWKHTGYQPFQCPHCCKRFRSYSDLVEHQRKHTKAYPYLCWECGKKFRHSVTMTRHLERVHNTGEPEMQKPLETYPCSQCGKIFSSRRCLMKHDNFHHKGMRFPCEHCGKGFFGKDALVRHTLIHTGERPFKCDDCDKSFRSSAELKIHRRYHTGERPFKCTVCSKGFVQSCFLTLHMRTHTGERPYVCSICNKGFSSLHGLKRHRRLVHT
ncbi:zinc finger protein 23-like [Synchiropus splendidus]|uniref:zinc finger protein 23-like n=1 Tax=Synchiropus splendidus TaxID=270530 RepID=UPI00237D4F0F|nr:zinc finger protein 23-like [Synchiropus splendidus]